MECGNLEARQAIFVSWSRPSDQMVRPAVGAGRGSATRARRLGLHRVRTRHAEGRTNVHGVSLSHRWSKGYHAVLWYCSSSSNARWGSVNASAVGVAGDKLLEERGGAREASRGAARHHHGLSAGRAHLLRRVFLAQRLSRSTMKQRAACIEYTERRHYD